MYRFASCHVAILSNYVVFSTSCPNIAGARCLVREVLVGLLEHETFEEEPRNRFTGPDSQRFNTVTVERLAENVPRATVRVAENADVNVTLPGVAVGEEPEEVGETPPPALERAEGARAGPRGEVRSPKLDEGQERAQGRDVVAAVGAAVRETKQGEAGPLESVEVAVKVALSAPVAQEPRTPSPFGRFVGVGSSPRRSRVPVEVSARAPRLRRL